jgi:hypothetical protein
MFEFDAPTAASILRFVHSLDANGQVHLVTDVIETAARCRMNLEYLTPKSFAQFGSLQDNALAGGFKRRLRP